ncbi:MAG: UDP-GlcNAc:undecaprenyl-phosphate/decaprenyl-phosphate GlcNAc-phosphate transferase [Thermoleophilaceae bacterium]|jgi:UDP-GlcNAc:undecaprenyl-phosphate GlcNAc-1-phosphate transferase|nr:UDP-GlcNAc:undecaprenyl-phosphate/decaprenyl-phosphate GlcNAc-phosphate transferase [Thermoleophilaceae bacterium]MEA2367744.1 UDP-GlcNAc:undecaprenyl-phosphate/decaprenyl-phosphate GlcNAc-phosphate transferase [Thermoleophilaceae bacterium]
MPSVGDGILGFGLALVIALLTTPVVKALAWRIGAIDEPRERGLHQFPTPRLGGLAILVAVAVGSLVLLPHFHKTHGILIGACVIAFVGAADDLLELKADFKLVGQLLAAVIPVTFGVKVTSFTLPFIGHVGLSQPLAYVLTILGLVALMNIVNFIDGVDGLAAGVCTIAALTFATIAFSQNRIETHAAGVLALLVAGASLGYLRHGFAPASIFLGDSGSNLLGYLLGTIVVQGALKTNALVGLAFPLVVLAVPILDSSFVVAKRIKYRRPVYQADRSHFHHRFANIGFSPRRTTLYLYGWTVVLACLALALRFVPYSDHHGHFDTKWVLVLAAFGIGALAASVYLVLVLEILKLKRFRQFQARRASTLAGEPEPSEVDIDTRVAHELETGEFEIVQVPPRE